MTTGTTSSARADTTARALPLLTIYASIGNSDDRLTQHRWSVYAASFINTIHRHISPAYLPGQIHGIWYSAPDSEFQNACVCFEATPDQAAKLRADLTAVRELQQQDSIAWAEVTRTEFI